MTHQLPFQVRLLLFNYYSIVDPIRQTYLAIYFCFVDVTLVGQYVYYHYTAKPITSFPTRSRTASTATITRRLSVDHPPTHYRALSHVAANVAAAAALAAQQEEHSRWRTHGNHSVESRHSAAPEDDEVDDDTLARLADSFHSDRGTTRKKVSWSRERASRGGSLGRSRPSAMSPLNVLPLVSTTSDFVEEPGSLDRGRPPTREVPLDESQTEWAVESTKRKNSRASRKGAGMVFLGVWALFGVGMLTGSRRGIIADNRIRVGRVLSGEVVIPAQGSEVSSVTMGAPKPPTKGSQQEASGNPVVSYDDLHFPHEVATTFMDDHDDHEGPSTEYVIGRISAWICTTLYLTSRLPQIWKNVGFRYCDISFG